MLVLVAAVSACHEERGALTFSPDELAGGSVGEAYEAAIIVSNNETPVGDMLIAEGELPPGLELVFEVGSDAGLIRGTPEETEEFRFTVSVWCFGTFVDGQTGDKEYAIVVE